MRGGLQSLRLGDIDNDGLGLRMLLLVALVNIGVGASGVAAWGFGNDGLGASGLLGTFGNGAWGCPVLRLELFGNGSFRRCRSELWAMVA